MSTRLYRTTAGAAVGTALAATFLLLPAAAATAVPPGAAATSSGECQITGGTLQWGVKESFRSYISGSIANGGWETTDEVTYDTPDFGWKNAQGSIDPATGVGSVSFAGGIHFTGHDGVLDLTFANPTIEFEGAGKAALMLDAKSTDMEGAVTVDAKQEWVGEVVAPTELSPEGGKLKLEGLPTTLTNSGATAFAGFYEAGQELDPLTLELTLEGCAGGAAEPAPGAPSAASDPGTGSAETDSSLPWAPIIVGGIALIVIALTVGMLIGGRKRPAQSLASSEGSDEEGATTTPQA